MWCGWDIMLWTFMSIILCTQDIYNFGVIILAMHLWQFKISMCPKCTIDGTFLCIGITYFLLPWYIKTFDRDIALEQSYI